MYWSILPILGHRVGLIFAFVSSVILVVLPSIFNQEEDLQFTVKISKFLIILLRMGLIILVITGVIRLTHGIPSRFTLKVLGVLITLYWSFIKIPSYPDPEYVRTHLIMVLLISLTAAIGVWL